MNQTDKVKIILLDDHLIFRDGLKSLLAQDEHVSIIGEASDAEQLFKILDRVIPDVLIADISLPDESGIEITRRMQAHYQCVSVLILSIIVHKNMYLALSMQGLKDICPKIAQHQNLKKPFRH